MPGPDCRVGDGCYTGLLMLFALRFEYLLEVGAILHELISLEVASTAPFFLECVDLADGEMTSSGPPDAFRKLVLVLNEPRIPDHSRSGRLVLLEEDILSSRINSGVRDRHHARPEHLRNTVTVKKIADPELFGHEAIQPPRGPPFLPTGTRWRRAV